MTDSGEQPGRFRRLEPLIARPVVAAFFSGVGINLFLAFNEQLIYGTNYLTEMTSGPVTSFMDGLSKMFIPFLLSYLLIHLSTRANIRQTSRSLFRFPEANPDIVLKLDDEGRVVYANQTAAAYLERLEIPEGEVESLLPDHYRELMAQLFRQPGVGYGSKAIDGVVIEYTFRTFSGEEGVFVSGRDITQKKKAEHAVTAAYRDMVGITGFLDKTLERFHPATFEPDEHFKSIVEKILAGENSRDGAKATHVFLGMKEDARLKGNVYSLWRGKVYKDPDEIDIDASSDKAAHACLTTELAWVNRKEEESINVYQQKFHSLLREKVGTIERFTTYTDGKIAVIAFFTGEPVDRFDAYLLKGIAIFANSLKRIAREVKETESAFEFTLQTLARAAEGNDAERCEHLVRVNEYSKLMADGLGLGSDFVRTISYSAQMHDVGKILLPRHMLKKSDSLTEEESGEMGRYTVYGAHLLGDSKRLQMAAEIALTHHEKFSGKGYPAGLKGEEIPMSGRIVKLADVYDTLRQNSNKKPGCSHEKAMEIITQGNGHVSPDDFDPRVLEVFVRLKDRMDEIFLQSKKPNAFPGDQREELKGAYLEQSADAPRKVA